MTSPLHILGDGLAGTLLADRLGQREVEFFHYGDGQVNTPPVAFVHLFQGRTFHRDPIEVTAFRKAIGFWRAERLAREWSVLRTVQKGDRLDRSASSETIPAEFRPRLFRTGETVRYRYEPGFTVAAGDLVARCRRHSTTPLRSRVEPKRLDGSVVHASGLSIADLLPQVRWDTNPGRTVHAICSDSPGLVPEHLTIDQGCHLGGNPAGSGFTVGGRVSSKGEAKNDEAEIASALLSREVSISSQWWGRRIANALDRWPLVGWLNERDFLFSGFGGRALFWLPYCIDLATEALVSGSNREIPERLRADRFESPKKPDLS
jgi:hypothetical protein